MESLSRIVDTALELSDLESGRCKAKKETTDVNAICDELVKKYSTRAHNGVSVSCTGEEVQPIVTDGEKLNKALSVLMNNACKFTYNGSIQLERHINGELLELSVTDTGCGIPADKSDDVFKNFYKVDSFVPGIGLGLPLCRSLTHLLGGEVSLDKSYTNGCRFTIKLVCG
jgi:signal transduction histidine kinase